ncbi:unnamed protein product [Closterium sp. NIES-64]|nr:unnamed protein product [Closterium sp. NIES-64]
MAHAARIARQAVQAATSARVRFSTEAAKASRETLLVEDDAALRKYNPQKAAMAACNTVGNAVTALVLAAAAVDLSYRVMNARTDHPTAFPASLTIHPLHPACYPSAPDFSPSHSSHPPCHLEASTITRIAVLASTTIMLSTPLAAVMHMDGSYNHQLISVYG